MSAGVAKIRVTILAPMVVHQTVSDIFWTLFGLIGSLLGIVWCEKWWYIRFGVLPLGPTWQIWFLWQETSGMKYRCNRVQPTLVVSSICMVENKIEDKLDVLISPWQISVLQGHTVAPHSSYKKILVWPYPISSTLSSTLMSLKLPYLESTWPWGHNIALLWIIMDTLSPVWVLSMGPRLCSLGHQLARQF